jgi:predicted nucleic acid-binding protein
MYLLDTDVLIWVLRGNEKIIDKVSEIKDKAPASISVLSVAEIYKNIFPSEITVTEEYLSQNIMFSVDERTAKQGGLYWQQYSKKLSKLSLIDCLIAATANLNDLVLVTLNTKHFPMKDFKVLNPLGEK